MVFVFVFAPAVVFLQLLCFPSLSTHSTIWNSMYLFSPLCSFLVPEGVSLTSLWVDVTCSIVGHPLSSWWLGPHAVLRVCLSAYCVSRVGCFPYTQLIHNLLCVTVSFLSPYCKTRNNDNNSLSKSCCRSLSVQPVPSTVLSALHS